MTGRAILRLVPPPGDRHAPKRMAFERHRPAARLAERTMRELRGRRISMVMQDPKFSLNPVMTVGHQIAEALPASTPIASAAEARRRALDMLEAVQHPRSRARLSTSIRTRSPAAWASAS